jgi:hypothetical protein
MYSQHNNNNRAPFLVYFMAEFENKRAFKNDINI